MAEGARTAKALLGFMDEQDALTFLKGMASLGRKTEEELKQLWTASNSAVNGLPAPNLDAAVLEIDDKFKPHLADLSKDPIFPEATQQKKWSFKLAEIDKLVCFQKYVYKDHAEEMAKEHDLSDAGKLIEFCLPAKRETKSVAVVSSPQEFTMLSSSQDLRVLTPVRTQDPITKRTIFGFAVGWGAPFVQVVQFKGRYFLRNGYHRVYEIRRRGVKHVPCILIETENFADTGALREGFFGERLLMSVKPPTFANFFSDEIAPTLSMKPLTKILRVRAEESMLPVILPAPQIIDETKKQALSQETAEPQKPVDDDIRVLKEDWNIYKLTDGTTLKVRQLLQRLRKQPQSDPSEENLAIETSPLLIATYPPVKLKGSPSAQEYSADELNRSVVQSNLGYTTVQEVVNEYVTTSGLKVSLQIASVSASRTNKFDSYGDPRYLVTAQSAIQIMKPADN